MSKIVLSRIDDRLIHGQVMTAWVQHVGGNEIVIVDDKVAKDPFLSSVITGAVPKHLNAHAMTVDDAAEYLEKIKDEDKNIIILAKGPKVFLDLLEKGVQVKEINLGGMGSTQERKKLYKNISASDEERDMLKQLSAQHVHVYIQVVPNMETVEINKIL